MRDEYDLKDGKPNPYAKKLKSQETLWTRLLKWVKGYNLRG